REDTDSDSPATEPDPEELFPPTSGSRAKWASRRRSRTHDRPGQGSRRDQAYDAGMAEDAPEEHPTGTQPEAQHYAVLKVLHRFLLSKALMRRSKQLGRQSFAVWRRFCVRQRQLQHRLATVQMIVGGRRGRAVFCRWRMTAARKLPSSMADVLRWWEDTGLRLWCLMIEWRRVASCSRTTAGLAATTEALNLERASGSREQRESDVKMASLEKVLDGCVQDRERLNEHLNTMRQSLWSAEDRVKDLEQELNTVTVKKKLLETENARLTSEVSTAQTMVKDVAEIEVYLKALRHHGVAQGPGHGTPLSNKGT
ncbi:hypothetical protein CYMTET_32841, partial [Cymbomonas tetramitiformis]